MEDARSRPFESNGDSWLTRACAGVQAAFRAVKFTRRTRLLHLREMLPLGEKRLLAVVEIESQRFLIGATSQSIQLLHQLGASSKEQEKAPISASRFSER
jgi:flagellar biogenesis protein FliO